MGTLISPLRGFRRVGATISVAVVAVVAVVVALLLSGSGSGSQRLLPQAKEFTLPALGHSGERVTLAAFAHRPVIINFFASWCPPCKRETPLLSEFYRQHHGRVAIVGVDVNDSAGKALRFVETYHVTYPVGFDPLPAPVALAYGVLALPQTFFLDSGHRIVKHIYGDVTMRVLTSALALMEHR